jgi:hypothetical protein
MATKNADIEYLRAAAIILTIFQHLNVLFRWTPHPLGKVENYLHFWGCRPVLLRFWLRSQQVFGRIAGHRLHRRA